MTKNIFNKGAFKIKAKVVDVLKGLDGSVDLIIRLEHFEGGTPVIERIEVRRDCMGNFSGVNA